MDQRSAVSVETLKAIAKAFNAHDLDAIMELYDVKKTRQLFEDSNRLYATGS